MIVAGIILLLPGVCASFFAYISITSSRIDDTVLQLMVISFLIAAGGVALLVAAIRGRRKS